MINKFKENDFEKIDRLFEIYKEYNSKVKEIEKEIESDEDKKQSLLEFQKNIVYFQFFFILIALLDYRRSNLFEKIRRRINNSRIGININSFSC